MMTQGEEQAQEFNEKFNTVCILGLAFTAVGMIVNACQSPDPEKLEAKQKERFSQAQEAFRQNGFSIVGATHRDNTVGKYAEDCFTLQKQPDNGEVYQACIYYKPRGNSISEIRSI